MADDDTRSAVNSDSRSEPRRRQVVEATDGAVLDTVQNGENSIPAVAQIPIAPGKNLSRGMKGEVSPHSIKGRISPRRRKSLSRRDKPAWLTVLSVLTKNSLLLMGLFFFGRSIYRWADHSNGTTQMPFASLDLEERLSELKSSLKKTTKMIQFQVEVLDQRVNSESETLRQETFKKIDERISSLQVELKKLELRSQSLETSLAGIKEENLVSRDEFEEFLLGFKNSEGRYVVGLEEMRRYAREVVQRELEKHEADGLGRVDYALAAGGAVVVRHSEAYVGKSVWQLIRGRAAVSGNAQKMLQPSFGEPGQCFALRGSSGFVDIRLRKAIIPDSVTLEHVAKSVAYDRSSAPRECTLMGWPEETGEGRLLAEFVYDLEKSNVQTFHVEPGRPVNVVRFNFTSNHGSSSHTCLYRLRVHGSVEHVPQGEK
ncbi:SUN domain-containing protein 2-like [Wolffia australiana]